MKKLNIIFIVIFCLFSISCATGVTYTVRRIKSNLDLSLDTKTSNYQYNWYVFKYLTDTTDKLNEGNIISFTLKGTPDYDIPEVKAYFAELRDPNLNSRQELEAAKEEGSGYVASTSQWIPLTEEFTICSKGTGGQEFEFDFSDTLKYDILDNTKAVMFVYLDGSELSENYFDYYDIQLQQAEEAAQELAEQKAERQNKKEKLTEEDSKYHTAEEYYSTFYKKELEKIGEKRVIIRDLTLRLEVISK